MRHFPACFAVVLVGQRRNSSDVRGCQESDGNGNTITGNCRPVFNCQLNDPDPGFECSRWSISAETINTSLPAFLTKKLFASGNCRLLHWTSTTLSYKPSPSTSNSFSSTRTLLGRCATVLQLECFIQKGSRYISQQSRPPAHRRRWHDCTSPVEYSSRGAWASQALVIRQLHITNGLKLTHIGEDPPPVRYEVTFRSCLDTTSLSHVSTNNDEFFGAHASRAKSSVLFSGIS